MGEWTIVDKSTNWGGGFGTRWLGLNVLVNSTYSPAGYGPLQVPLGMYLSPEERQHYSSAITAQLSVKGELASLPLGYTFRVFAANPHGTTASCRQWGK
ncbi:MAG: hypothetical protein DDT37_00898 [Firmicutes bacterium]|nr:hypothetical protein [candidate division NPL-UPA2 bacterium]